MINDEMIMDELFLPRDDSQDNYISSKCLFDLMQRPGGLEFKNA